MDETLGYAIFGCCLVCAGGVLLALFFSHQWKRSEQRAQAEYRKFKAFMEEMEISEESERFLIRNLKSVDELYYINTRLGKCLHHESKL